MHVMYTRVRYFNGYLIPQHDHRPSQVSKTETWILSAAVTLIFFKFLSVLLMLEVNCDEHKPHGVEFLWYSTPLCGCYIDLYITITIMVKLYSLASRRLCLYVYKMKVYCKPSLNCASAWEPYNVSYTGKDRDLQLVSHRGFRLSVPLSMFINCYFHDIRLHNFLTCSLVKCLLNDLNL